MTTMSKARYSIFFCLLLASLVCESFAVSANSLKKRGPRNLQIAESDNPREVLKRAIYARRNVKSYRLRAECLYAGSNSKEVMRTEVVSPDRARLIQKDAEIIYIGKESYLKHGEGP